MPISAYDGLMARAATTTDAFNAVAEPGGGRSSTPWRGASGPSRLGRAARRGAAGGVQTPAVLREVGLVQVRDEGRQRIYRLEPAALREVYEWVKDYERLWTSVRTPGRGARWTSRRGRRNPAATIATSESETTDKERNHDCDERPAATVTTPPTPRS